MTKSVFIVDTNVVLRFLLKDDVNQSPIAKRYFLSEQNHLVIPITVFCEVVWVLKKQLKLSNTFIAEILNDITSQSNILFNVQLFNSGIDFLVNGGDFADGIIASEVNRFDNAYFLSFDNRAKHVAKQLNIAFEQPQHEQP